MHLPSTFDDLFLEATQLNLYRNLIRQLNKDFLLANIELDFHEDILPSSLKLILQDTIFTLIQEKFSDYLNLLYIIDVPEHKVKDLNGDDPLKLSEDVSLLILIREWQKVWFRNKY